MAINSPNSATDPNRATPPGPLNVDLRRAARFIADLRNLTLSEKIEAAVTGYEKVGERNSFLWKWVRRGVEITSLSSIDEELWDYVCDTKTLGVMFDVLLDDVADAAPKPEFLEALISITENRPNLNARATDVEREYFDYSLEIWEQIWHRLEQSPRYEEFHDVLTFDYRQLMTAMRYSVLIGTNPAMMNMLEHDAYLPHNMHMVVNGTIDLMASKRFDVAELGNLRRILLYAQHMGRIGNLVTTWEREVRSRDYSSGIFPMALSRGILTVNDLIVGDQEKICAKIRASNLEETFLKRWRELRENIVRLASRLRSVNVLKLVGGLDTLIQLHGGSRGLK